MRGPSSTSRVSRREALLWIGAAAVGAPLSAGLLSGCNKGTASSTPNEGSGENNAGGGIRGQKGSKTTLKFASTQPTHSENAHTVWFDAFVDKLHSATGGRVGAIFYGDSQLGPQTGYVNQVQVGTVDMTMGPDLYSSVVPQVSVLTMGFLFDSLDQLGQALDGTAGKLVQKIFAKHVKAEILGWAYNFGGRNVLCKKPIKSPADFHGVKLRVQPAPTFVQTFKLLGAEPVAMSFGEVYTSLQTGVIDGLEHDSPTILQNKLYEIAKNLTLTQHIFDPLSPVIANVSLTKLSSSDQGALRDAAASAVTTQRAKAKSTASQALDTLKQKGVKTYDIDRAALKKEVQPLWTSFTAKYPDTKPVLDAILSTT